jgi:hypothetical protein
VVAAGAWSYGTYVRLWLTRPSPQDYAQAAREIRAGFQPGDLIDANPFWAARVRESLGDLPMAAFHDLAREDLGRYRRLWLFSLFGAERRDAVAAALAEKAVLRDERRFGRIDVRLYEVRDHEPVRFDFREQLGRARVWMEAPGGRRPCSVWEQGRWRCSPAPWNYVGRETLEMAGEPRAVIWAHPVAGATLTVDFGEVPFGRALTVAAGLTAAAARFAGAPVELTVEAAGRPVLSRTYGREAAVSTERIDTRALAGSVGRVTFKVSTTDDRLRHFCFTAETRG